jgi:hypothetical protein
MALFGWGRKGTSDGVPRDWHAALLEVLAPLDRLQQPVADYVVTGHDHTVLAQLQGNGWMDDALGRWASQSVSGAAGARFAAGYADVDPEVVHRWVRVVESSGAGHNRWGTAMAPVGGRGWPEVVLRHARRLVPDGPLPFTLDDLVRVLELDGASAADLLVAALDASRDTSSSDGGGVTALVRLPGFDQLVVTHADRLREAAGHGPADRRVRALTLLGVLDRDALAGFADVVALGATANAKDVRRLAGDLLGRLDDDVALGALRGLATGGRPEERHRALTALHERARDDAERTWTEDTAAADRAASVRGLLEAWRVAAQAPPDEQLELPPLAPVDWAVPRAVARSAASDLVDDLVESVTTSNQQNAQWVQGQRAAGHPVRSLERPVPDRRLADRLAALLAAPEPVTGTVQGLDARDLWHLGRGAARHAVALGPVGTVQLLRACATVDDAGSRGGHWVDAVEALHRETGAPDLSTLQQLFDGVGLDGFRVVWSAYRQSWSAIARDWPDDDVWPFVVRNLDAVLAEGSSDDQLHYYDPTAFFTALAAIPTPPARAVEHLYAVALSPQRSLRGLAQDALVGDPARATRAAAALSDGRGEIRTVAAQWLARIADPATLPALRAAWLKEKSDVVRGALLDALEALGEPVADYLDVEATAARADKLVARGIPAALSWLAWDAVLEVRWAESGEPVPTTILQWLAINAVKAKSPEPNALLRRYAELIEPTDRRRLGHHLLTAWIAEDTRPVPLADAEQQARQMAVSQQRWSAGDPTSPYHGKSLAEIAAALLPGLARQPAGSAIASKGLLAVVAATAGRDVVAPTERYLKEWYGQRAAQGKALIGMLAWVDHPSATQLVLSVGSRFRTKSFQQEATAQAQALAERKGWTLDELADRTIPTAGFESTPDGAVLELSYGPRVFTARLLPDLTVVLQDPDATVVKALPAPRQSDDADLAKDAKKAFAAAKKDVKAIAKLQGERLYEALCTERDWPADDWLRYLVAHPVVGPAVRRLVWVDTDTGTSFRPLDDGSLTDVDDREVELDPAHRVRLAHDSVLPPDVVHRWLEHLADYEVDPLFQQLGKGTYHLPEERRGDKEVADHEGHLLEAFALRGRALRSGYTRGPSEDAGWFYSYRKRFPTLGLVAQVGFTGNYLPEENRTVALTRLSFHRELPEGRGEVELTLGDVPAVLLSEMVGDLRLFAADGTGFDPDWHHKTELR